MLIFVFIMLHLQQTHQNNIYNENWCLFQVTPGTITLSNYMHNANFCFCHVTPGTNTLKMKIDVFFK